MKVILIILILSIPACSSIRVKVATDCIVFTEKAPDLSDTTAQAIIVSNIDDDALRALNQLDNWVAKFNQKHDKFC